MAVNYSYAGSIGASSLGFKFGKKRPLAKASDVDTSLVAQISRTLT